MNLLASTYLRQARTFLRAGDTWRAIELLETAKTVARDDTNALAEILEVLATAYQQIGSLEQAERCNEQLRRLSPSKYNEPILPPAPSRSKSGSRRAWTIGITTALLLACAIWGIWKWRPTLFTASPAQAIQPTTIPASEAPNASAINMPAINLFPSLSTAATISEKQLQDCVALLVLLGDYEGDVDGVHYKMEMPLGSGTAFVVKRSGVLLTAKHVTHEAKENKFDASLGDLQLPTLTLRSIRYVLCFGPNPKDWSDAKLLYESDKFDLAVLHTDRQFATALDCTGRSMIQGEDVYSLGFPGALAEMFNGQFADHPRIKKAMEELKETRAVNLLDGFNPECFKASLTRGIISVAERNITGAAYTQSDVKVSPGNSGGPLLDSNHRVIGIVIMGVNDEPGYNFALLTNQIQDEIAPYMSDIKNDQSNQP